MSAIAPGFLRVSIRRVLLLRHPNVKGEVRPSQDQAGPVRVVSSIAHCQVYSGPCNAQRKKTFLTPFYPVVLTIYGLAIYYSLAFSMHNQILKHKYYKIKQFYLCLLLVLPIFEFLLTFYEIPNVFIISRNIYTRILILITIEIAELYYLLRHNSKETIAKM